MKRMFLFLALLALLTAQTQAKIWTVDNNPGNTAQDFTSASAAISSGSVAAGDTLHVQGSAISHGTINLTKRLVITGPGYFLGENPNSQANLASATFGFFSVNAGGAGSVLEGLYITGTLTISTNNVVVRRCRIFPGGNSTAINVSGSISNNTIAQCYIFTNNGSTQSMIVSGNATSTLFLNNYIENTNAGIRVIDLDANSANTQITGNVIRGVLSLNNAVVTNNILREGIPLTLTNVTSNNNVCNGTQLAGVQNVDMTTVFVGTGSSDGKWQLKAGSPAIGAGVGGTDCGMFGGVSPYVLAGVPPIPAIYFFLSPNAGSATAGLPVQMKVKSRN